MRKLSKAMTIVVVLAASIIALVGCAIAPDGKYMKKIAEYKFWSNTPDTAIAQTKVNDIIKDHVNAESSKTKKVLVIGFDGARADGLANIINTGNEDSGTNGDQLHSGVNLIRGDGGTYIAYAGGEKGTKSQQHTSTAPGWAAINTGVWGELNGITNNNMAKPITYKTTMLKLAETKGMKTEFVAQWDEHFNLSYKSEIDYLASNSNIDMKYTHITTDNEQGNKDYHMYNYLKETLTVGHENERDYVFTIFEAPDYNGHATNFGNINYRYTASIKNIDAYAYDLINTVQSRSTYGEEDWLIIMTSDHGGISTWHGNQTLEERTIFIVSNKKIDSKYYSSNYDGYKCK